MKKRIFINGFGRIGRILLRILLNDDTFNIIGINDISKIKNFEYLLKYDSIYGTYDKEIILKDNYLHIDTHDIKLFSVKDLSLLNLEPLDIDILFQCNGKFLSLHDNKIFLQKKVKNIIISAPPIDNMPTFIMGFNHKDFNFEKIISNSSCSSNAISPILNEIDIKYGIDSVCISMIHSYTNEQYLLDNNGYSEAQKLRSSTQNILPLSSTATSVLSKLFNNLNNNIYTKSIRVPLNATTLYDFTIFIKKNTTIDELNQLFIDVTSNKLYGIIDTCNSNQVSSDFIKNKHSAIIDLNLTEVINNNCIKILAWQDNEYGYSYQLMNMAKHITSP